MEIKTLKGKLEFEVEVNWGKVTKIEKWNTFSTTTTTTSTGGGGHVYTDIFGKVKGHISPVYTDTTHKTQSNINTRIFYGDSGYITLENCDFITAEGNELKILYYIFNNQSIPVAVKDSKTGFKYTLVDDKTFIAKVLDLKVPSFPLYTILAAIGITVQLSVYTLLKSWNWWSLFIIAAEIFLVALFGFFYSNFLMELYYMTSLRSAVITKETYNRIISKMHLIKKNFFSNNTVPVHNTRTLTTNTV